MRKPGVYYGRGQEKTAVTASEMGDLVRRSQRGDRAAVASLVAEWEPRVRRVVRRLIPDSFDADDVTQDSLLTALTRLGQLRDPGRSAEWVCAIARNAAVSCIRKTRVQYLLDDVADPALSDQESQIAQLRLLVRAATANLSALRRRAIVQHYYRGLSYIETAEVEGVSVDTVRSRLQKARSVLREEISAMAQGRPEQYVLSARDLLTLGLLVEVTTVDERHPALQGILLDAGGWAIATDGRRLIRRRLGGLGRLSVPVLLGPWRGAEGLYGSSGASLSLHGQVATFQTEGRSAHEIGVMDATFPDYRAVIPSQEPVCAFTVPSKSLRRALQALLPDRSSERNAVTMDVVDGVVGLCVRRPAFRSEAAVRIIPSTCSSESGIFSVCLDSRYMESAIRGVQSSDDDTVQIALHGGRRPVGFTNPRLDNDIAVVAPLEPATAA